MMRYLRIVIIIVLQALVLTNAEYVSAVSAPVAGSELLISIDGSGSSGNTGMGSTLADRYLQQQWQGGIAFVFTARTIAASSVIGVTESSVGTALGYAEQLCGDLFVTTAIDYQLSAWERGIAKTGPPADCAVNGNSNYTELG